MTRRLPGTSDSLRVYRGSYQFEILLILQDGFASRITLNHASHTCSARGAPLRNKWSSYPKEGHNPGKPGIIPYSSSVLERPLIESDYAP